MVLLHKRICVPVKFSVTGLLQLQLKLHCTSLTMFHVTQQIVQTTETQVHLMHIYSLPKNLRLPPKHMFSSLGTAPVLFIVGMNAFEISLDTVLVKSDCIASAANYSPKGNQLDQMEHPAKVVSSDKRHALAICRGNLCQRSIATTSRKPSRCKKHFLKYATVI